MRQVWWWALGLFFALSVVYGLSSARTMTGAADSDELIAAGFSWSLPHPPGFPLLMVMVRLVTMVFADNPAFGAHLLAGWLMAGAVAMGFVSVALILCLETRKKMTLWEWGLLAMAGFGVGLSGLIWEHGVHLEVFSLLALLSMLLLAVVVQIEKTVELGRDVSVREWLLLAVVIGLGLSHHQLFGLSLVSVLGWFFWRTRVNAGRSWVSMLMVLLGGLLVWVFVYAGLMWWIASAGSPDSWRLGDGWQGLWDFYWRRDFSGVLMDNETLTAWFSRVEIRGIVASLDYYVRRWWSDWGVFGLIGVGGIVFSKRYIKQYWELLFAGFIVCGVLLAGYIAVPGGLPGTVSYEVGAMVVERMYVLGELWWGLWMIVGIYVGVQVLAPLMVRKSWWYGVMGLVVVGFGVMLWRLWPSRSLASYRAPLEYMEAVMADLPQESRLLCLSDLSCFGSFYYQAVLGKRTDVVVVPAPVQHRLGRMKSVSDLTQFWYMDNPYRLGEVIGYATLQEKPVYVTQLTQDWMDVLGFSHDVFWLYPDGYRFGVTREGGVPTRQTVMDQQTEAWASETMPDYGLVRAFKAVVVEQHVLQSAVWRSLGVNQAAAAELEAAWELWPENEYVVNAALFIDQIEVNPARFDLRDSRFYWDQARECRDRNTDGCDVSWARWLVWRYPTDPAARSWLARSLELAGQLPLAKREYGRALTLDPTYSEANFGLTRLEGVADLEEYFY